MTDDELKALVASLAVSQDRTDEQMKRTYEQIKATDEQIASLAVAQQETTRKLDKLGELYGNIGRNQGDVAEEFFFNSLIKNNRLGNIHFDDVVKNMEKPGRGRIAPHFTVNINSPVGRVSGSVTRHISW